VRSFSQFKHHLHERFFSGFIFLDIYQSRSDMLRPSGFLDSALQGELLSKNIQREIMCCLCCDSNTIWIKEFFLVLSFITIHNHQPSACFTYVFSGLCSFKMWSWRCMATWTKPFDIKSMCSRFSPLSGSKQVISGYFLSMRPSTQPAPSMIWIKDMYRIVMSVSARLWALKRSKDRQRFSRPP